MGHFRFLTAVSGFMLLQSLLFASPQWLQYRTSGRAKDIVGGRSQYMQPEKSNLDSEKIPETNESDPIFVKWNGSLGKDGFRWIMLGKKHKHGLCDLLYIDSDGDGDLTDEQKIEGKQTNQYEVEFPGVPVYFEGEDGPITYHLNLHYYKHNEDNERLSAYAGCWYEGQVKIGDKKTHFVLVDYNCNGTFDDKSKDFNSDRILIGPEQKTVEHYVGNFLEYDEKLYRVNIAEDGAFIDLTPSSEVTYGTITMPESITSFSAGGMNGMFNRTVENGQATLPEGDYRVYSWEIARNDNKGVEWKLEGSGFPSNKNFVVKADSAANLDIGEPVFSKLDSESKNGAYSFNQSLSGKSGERISLTKAGRRVPAPKVHIRNKTGKYDRTFTLEYG